MTRVWNIRSVTDMAGEVDQVAEISGCLAEAATRQVDISGPAICSSVDGGNKTPTK